MAGETGFEPATNGFGDRYSTVELLPYGKAPIQYTKSCIIVIVCRAVHRRNRFFW